ncbi:MAG: hypothetical protein NC398_06140 [Acetatifactor muris]|nr:hypothetical protein [Acetatifactor muris]MCM1526671.1 hypothetical protein [Bacteroides sp.]
MYEDIVLRPGVYRIELQYTTDTDTNALCNVTDGTVFTGGLLSNGEHLYSARHRTGYDIWLYENTEHLQVTVSYDGRGNLAAGSLRVVETNLLWTMLLTIVLFLWAASCVCIGYHYHNKTYPIARERKNAFFFVVVFGLLASIPYLCGYNIVGGDLTYHLQRIEGVKDGLLGGQFPVRIEPKWIYDHGHAAAIFYCNAFLYFPALLRLLGFTVSTSYNIYCITVNFAAAGISYYCFGKIFRSRTIGIVCSGLYTLSVFRIYRLIITSAVGDGTALTFLPLILYGLYRVFAEDPKEERYKTSFLPLTLGLCGILWSHALSCEITAGVIIVFCLVYIRKIFCLNTFLELCKAALSSILLSLWFVVPFLDYFLTQDFHVRHISGRMIQYRGLLPSQLVFHFWTSVVNAARGVSEIEFSYPSGVGPLLLIVLCLFLILWLTGRLRNLDARMVRFVKITALFDLLILCASTNVFPWDRIQFINSITETLVGNLEFPYRFVGWGTACVIFVFGFCLQYMSENRPGFARAMTVAASLGIMISSMYLLSNLNSTHGFFTLYNEEGMGFGYISSPEFIIEGTDESLLTFADPVAGEGVELSDYAKRYYHTVLKCVNHTAADSYVDLPILLYKGYRAIDSDSGQRLQIADGANHLVRVILPPHYEGTVEVDFVSPFYWRIGEGISAAMIILLVVWGLRRRRSVKSDEEYANE